MGASGQSAVAASLLAQGPSESTNSPSSPFCVTVLRRRFASPHAMGCLLAPPMATHRALDERPVPRLPACSPSAQDQTKAAMFSGLT